MYSPAMNNITYRTEQRTFVNDFKHWRGSAYRGWSIGSAWHCEWAPALVYTDNVSPVWALIDPTSSRKFFSAIGYEYWVRHSPATPELKLVAGLTYGTT